MAFFADRWPPCKRPCLRALLRPDDKLRIFAVIAGD
jgi:hypothetical protein